MRETPAGDFDYETQGAGCGVQRRADPRIGALVIAALGSARTVINVGAAPALRASGSVPRRDRAVCHRALATSARAPGDRRQSRAPRSTTVPSTRRWRRSARLDHGPSRCHLRRPPDNREGGVTPMNVSTSRPTRRRYAVGGGASSQPRPAGNGWRKTGVTVRGVSCWLQRTDHRAACGMPAQGQLFLNGRLDAGLDRQPDAGGSRLGGPHPGSCNDARCAARRHRSCGRCRRRLHGVDTGVLAVRPQEHRRSRPTTGRPAERTGDGSLSATGTGRHGLDLRGIVCNPLARRRSGQLGLGRRVA